VTTSSRCSSPRKRSTRSSWKLAAKIDAEYAGKDLLIVGVLKGAVMVMADLARALSTPVTMDWMAVSSYGAGTQSSGVVRILKDLDTDIKGKHVLIVEDIIDSGLTLSWLISNLGSREPDSLRICTLLRKPEAAKVAIEVEWVGFDIPNEFVVGYGLDYAEEVPQPAVRRYARAARLRRLEPLGPSPVRRSGTPAGFSRRWSMQTRLPTVPVRLRATWLGYRQKKLSLSNSLWQEGRSEFAPYGWT